MDIEIIRYCRDDKSQWNAFIMESKNGLFFFQREYMDYHSDRITDHSVIFKKKDQILAVFPANENENNIVSHGGLTYGSLIVNKKIKAIEVLEIFNILTKYYKSQRFDKIIYKTIPYIFHTQPSQEDLYVLFIYNAKLVRRDISSVFSLQNKLPFANSPSRRHKKCLKLDLIIRENSNFSQYWELLTDVLKVNHSTMPVHTLEEIQMLADSFPNNIKLFEVLENGNLISGTVIFDFGNTVHTQYLANSERGREIGALDFLIIELIENRLQDKAYLSFGISTENQGRFLNEGLINQKEMYGGRAVCNDFYEIDLN